MESVDNKVDIEMANKALDNAENSRTLGRVTYLESLKSNLIRAYETRAPGFSRSIEMPVMPTSLKETETEKFLKAVGRLSGMDDIGLKIDREIRNLPSKSGEQLQSLIIILTPETDMDIDRVFDIIKEYEG